MEESNTREIATLVMGFRDSENREARVFGVNFHTRFDRSADDLFSGLPKAIRLGALELVTSMIQLQAVKECGVAQAVENHPEDT